MNPENIATLKLECPNLFRNDYATPSCGDGWFDIVYAASKALEAEIEGIDMGKSPWSDYDDLPRALQVKEKFGGLRFYISWGTGEMRKIVAEAEELCWKTCEQCGAEGASLDSSTPWIITLCGPCKERRAMARQLRNTLE